MIASSDLASKTSLAIQDEFQSAFSIHPVHQLSHCTADGPEPKWDVDTNKYVRVVHDITFGKEVLWVQKKPEFTCADIEKAELLEIARLPPKIFSKWNREHPDAVIEPNYNIPPDIFIKFTPEATVRLETLTERLHGGRLALFAFDSLLVAPVIKATITDGKVSVTVCCREKAQQVYDKIKSSHPKKASNPPSQPTASQ